MSKERLLFEAKVRSGPPRRSLVKPRYAISPFPGEPQSRWSEDARCDRTRAHKPLSTAATSHRIIGVSHRIYYAGICHEQGYATGRNGANGSGCSNAIMRPRTAAEQSN